MALGFDALSENPLSGIFIAAGGPVNYADSLLAGSYTLAGKAVSDSVVRADSLSTGAYSIAGKSITDLLAKNDSLSTGGYAIAGKTVSDSVVRGDLLSVGAYSISGKTVTDSVARADSLAKGSYAITGNNVNDVVTSGGIAYADNLNAGSYSVTGYSLSDTVVITDLLSAGAYTVTGNNLNDAITGKIVVAQSTPGFKLTPKFKGETQEEKRLRRESQGIVARAKVIEPEQEDQLFADAQDVIEQLKLEVARLETKAEQFSIENRHAEMIRAQLAQEQLEAQIEEIDTAFVVFMLIAQLD